MSGRLAGWLTFVGVLAALNYASRFVAGEQTGTTDSDVFYRWDFFVAGAVQLVVMGIVLYFIARGAPAARLLALRPPRSWGFALGLMIAVFVGVLVLGAILNPLLDPGAEQGLVPSRWRPDDAVPFGANLGLTALAVPVVEELTFRGAGYGLLVRYGRWVAILGTGIVFGLAHGLVLALPILVAFGIGLALLRSRTASVLPGMVLHGMFNAFSVLVSVFG